MNPGGGSRAALALLAGAMLVASLAWFAACGARTGAETASTRLDVVDATGSPPRAGRFGSLRDFVLVERADVGPEGALFVDRFEVTQDDWAQFANTAEGRAVAAGAVALVGNPALPVGNVDLRMARAFAAWRFARLPSALEWQLVSLGDGRSRFPWGSKQDPARANTGELGLGEATPVGTFESGRKAGGDAPYDLVGNVAEWTETVPWSWCGGRLAVAGSFARAWRAALAMPALAVWRGPGGLIPSGAIVAAGGDGVPRLVVGADFLTPMIELTGEQQAGERRRCTGLRIYATAAELVTRLTTTDVAVDQVEREQLRRFVARGRHRAVLRAALAAVGEPAAAGPAGREFLAAIQASRGSAEPR